MAGPAANKQRDLRLDFFRGIALFFIFIDHIPNNILGWFTLWAIGFSDAAEVFIFISGYTAALVYGNALRRHGPMLGSAQVLHRVWQLYIAHLFLFLLLTAMVSYTVLNFDNPMYAEELRVGSFLAEPHIAIIKALLLQFQPIFLDILPLYIVLLLFFPVVLLAIERHVLLALIPAAMLYAAQYWFNLAPAAYPDDREWVFNPYAWQLLFVIGATCGHARIDGRAVMPAGRLRDGLLLLAGVFLVFALVIRMSWTIHLFYEPFPGLLLKQLYPISKTDMAPLRLAHFLALAVVVVHFLKAENPIFAARWAKPIVICGQHSLHIFCLGILLSVIGHLVLTEIDGSLPAQFAVNIAGLALMIGMAMLLEWYKRASRAPAPALDSKAPAIAGRIAPG